MHNHMHEKLVQLHRDELTGAAQRSRLRAIVRATRPPRWKRQQRLTTMPSADHPSQLAARRVVLLVSTRFDRGPLSGERTGPQTSECPIA
jgi:hypothetical protein